MKLFACIHLALAMTASAVLAADHEGGEADSGAGLPPEYGKFLVARNTVSPDGKLALIYPKAELCDDDNEGGVGEQCKDYVVALQPFKVLAKLETDWSHFQNKSNGGMNAQWSNDSSVALVVLVHKWGPGDIFLFE